MRCTSPSSSRAPRWVSPPFSTLALALAVESREACGGWEKSSARARGTLANASSGTLEKESVGGDEASSTSTLVSTRGPPIDGGTGLPSEAGGTAGGSACDVGGASEVLARRGVGCVRVPPHCCTGCGCTSSGPRTLSKGCCEAACGACPSGIVVVASRRSSTSEGSALALSDWLGCACDECADAECASCSRSRSWACEYACSSATASPRSCSVSVVRARELGTCSVSAGGRNLFADRITLLGGPACVMIAASACGSLLGLALAPKSPGVAMAGRGEIMLTMFDRKPPPKLVLLCSAFGCGCGSSMSHDARRSVGLGGTLSSGEGDCAMPSRAREKSSTSIGTASALEVPSAVVEERRSMASDRMAGWIPTEGGSSGCDRCTGCALGDSRCGAGAC
mmetsp:Transcript_51977/g.122939  ORF Transcript_51977/g.122939 Transcript_51977/m.122939 type:complete len:396 (+) Transcript_51977:277-1464(+)